MLFVLGSGIVVMRNARTIVAGGSLAVSLCFLLSSVFAYRWYVQLFQFSRCLRMGSSRFFHRVIIFVCGFSSLVYGYTAFVLFVQ